MKGSTAFFAGGQWVKAQFTRSKSVKGLQPVDIQNVELVQCKVIFLQIYKAATTTKVPRKDCETMHSRWKTKWECLCSMMGTSFSRPQTYLGTSYSRPQTYPRTTCSIRKSMPSVLIHRCLEWTLQWSSVTAVHEEQYCSISTAGGVEVMGSRHFYCVVKGSRGKFSGQKILTPSQV